LFFSPSEIAAAKGQARADREEFHFTRRSQ
jgi:hypothetical protein